MPGTSEFVEVPITAFPRPARDRAAVPRRCGDAGQRDTQHPPQHQVGVPQFRVPVRLRRKRRIGLFRDRHHPLARHCRKLGARPQAATSSRHPVLIQVQADSGHGTAPGKRSAHAADIDVLTFLAGELGLEPR
ncbi:hypothetical protein [Amycolatopsis sulphurea]|uniref:hypothetical protein n=1 Tax=Amycolatopsis sulphurea TaxID=76022 RepID=UPI000BFA7EAB|nr:hypothetical protein [Amycolatopsis sulphurea]